jgi:hypothetical protein
LKRFKIYYMVMLHDFPAPNVTVTQEMARPAAEPLHGFPANVAQEWRDGMYFTVDCGSAWFAKGGLTGAIGVQTELAHDVDETHGPVVCGLG